MNERIREIAGQAKFMAEETINKQISKNAELDAFAEKFAELIVRECLNICVEQEEHWRDFGKIDVAMGAGICVDRLEQHFGGEE